MSKQTHRTSEVIEIMGDINLRIDYSFTREPFYADGDIWPMEYKELQEIHSINLCAEGCNRLDLTPFIQQDLLEAIGAQLSYEVAA